MSATGSSWPGRTDDPVAAPGGGVGPSVPSGRPAPSGRVAAVGVSGDGRHWCQLVDGCQQSLAPWLAPSWVVASREPSMAPACYARADRGSAGGSARQARRFRVSLVEPGDGAGVAPLGPLRGPRPSGSRRSRGGRRCGHHRPHLTQRPSGRRRGHVRGAAGAAATRRYPAARRPCGGPMAAWITPAHRSYLRWQWLPSTPPSAHGTQLRSPSTPGPKLVGSSTGRAPGRRPPSDALPGSLGGPLGMLRNCVRVHSTTRATDAHGRTCES
jgi:hypothetical protein